MTHASLTALGLGLLLLEAGCRHAGPAPPSRLSDGSTARPLPVVLAGVESPTVTTRVRVVVASAIGPDTAAARCLGSSRRSENVVVERVDVRGASVTYLGPRRRSAHACESSGSTSRAQAGWCGRAFGMLAVGRLHDPRLSLSCRDDEDEPVAFAWIQPGASAAYVVVDQAGYHEVYPVAGSVPVRVSTSDVDLATSRATFTVSEHTNDGRRLRGYELEAAVSG